MFTQNVPTENLNFFIICIPFSLILGFTIIVLNKSNIMFICTQAPYNMNALLLGLLFMLQTMFFTFGDLLFEVWKNKWFHPALLTSTHSLLLISFSQPPTATDFEEDTSFCLGWGTWCQRRREVEVNSLTQNPVLRKVNSQH